MTTHEWGKLTRRDLATFHPEMRDIVLSAMERGGTGRISTKGHAILRGPAGVGTMSVAPKVSRNRNLLNIRADFNRLFGGTQPLEPVKKAAASPDIQVATSVEPRSAQLPCPVEGCDEKFVVEGARYSHIEKTHHRCSVPGCGRAFASKQGASMHWRRAHEGFNPGKKKPAVKEAAIVTSDDTKLVEQIRKILGSPDAARVKELEDALSASEARVKELEAKLSKLRDALQ